MIFPHAAPEEAEIPTVSPSRPLRILIVEDDSLIALSVRSVLEGLGYAICGIAASEPEAIALAEQTRPDLTLMDVRLRGPVDGVDVAQRLRTEFGVRSLYLSAYADHQTMTRITATYPLGFVQKPYSAGQLKSALDLAIRRMRG